jgi:hypothetical protein
VVQYAAVFNDSKHSDSASPSELKEGYMARRVPKRSEQLPIDRRGLLKTSVATMAAATLAPNLSSSETTLVVSAQTNSTASEAILNVSAATARRLAALAGRNVCCRCCWCSALRDAHIGRTFGNIRHHVVC